jgi:glc operon protein GlcG
MPLTRSATKLTAEAALALVQEAAKAAAAMGQPQCIVVVDEGCNLLALLRMDGARLLSIESARRKAETAAASGKPTGGLPLELETKLALATGGRMTNLKGGVPILVEGQVVGGIGIGSGTGEQDLEVATAAIAAVFGVS